MAEAREAVYVRKRVARRRSFFQKHKVLVLFLVGASVCFLWCLFTEGFRKPPASVKLAAPPAITVPETDPGLQPAKYERVVYPYSVIPGGAYSRQELAARAGEDRVVANHFADFALNQARAVRSEADKMVHVSYRLGDKVFWTQKTIKVPKGEALMTDGRDFARARCGNRISVLPQAPVSEEEPDVAAFEVAVPDRPEPFSLEILPDTGLEVKEFSALNAPGISPVIPIAPILPMRPPPLSPHVYYPPFVIYPPANDLVVPEPGTLGLLLAGLTVFSIYRCLRRK